MSYFSEILSQLQHASYLRLSFQLEFSESFFLPQGALLQLRREFLGALTLLRTHEHSELYTQLHELFMPPLPAAQLLRQQVKSPPPGIILAPQSLSAKHIAQGDSVSLMAMFVGDSISKADDFMTLLGFLGTQGIFCGAGRYVIKNIQTEDGNGNLLDLNIADNSSLLSQCQVGDFKWWLESHICHGDTLTIEFLSPLRLVKSGKPVFKPDVAKLIKALVNRVATVIAYHCHIDLFFDRYDLNYLITSVTTKSNNLRWQDWRQLQGAYHHQKIGGVLGRMDLSLNGDADLIWLWQLGHLLNLGKSAAFGSGQYHLTFGNN